MNETDTESLPESIRDWNEVKESKDLNSFWDQMKNMRSKLGSSLFQPGKDAGDEDWGKFSTKAVELSKGRLMPKPDLDNPEHQKAFHKSLGVPDDAKDYEFDNVENSTLGNDRKDFISKIAKEANLSKSQLKTLDKRYREEDVRLYNVQKEILSDDLKALNQEWGLAAEDRINSAKKVQKAFFPQTPEEFEMSAGDLKSMYSLYVQLGEKTQEFNDQEHQNKGGITPEEASVKISEIRNNSDHPYNNRRDPGHDAAKKIMRNLYLSKSA